MSSASLVCGASPSTPLTTAIGAPSAASASPEENSNERITEQSNVQGEALSSRKRNIDHNSGGGVCKVPESDSPSTCATGAAILGSDAIALGQSEIAQKHKKQKSASEHGKETYTAGRPPWATLHRDSIDSITRYLSLTDFARCARVCTCWRNASDRVGARSDSVHLDSYSRSLASSSSCVDYRDRHRAALQSLLESRWVRHITQLTQMRVDTNTIERGCNGMNRLTHLECTIDLDQSEDQSDSEAGQSSSPFPFPSTLTSLALTITLSFHPNVDAAKLRFAPYWSRTVRSLYDLPVLTDLTIGFELNCHAQPPDNFVSTSMESLLPLRDKLRSIRFGWSPINQHKIYDCALLRQFHGLAHLDLDDQRWSTEEINQLFAAPFTMSQLKYFNFGSIDITEDMAEPIARATGFTAFHVAALHVHNPTFLSAYQQLESCTLNCSGEVDADRLVAALSHCTRITNLNLFHPSLTGAQLELLLSHLPLISSLKLDDMYGLNSLAFASRVPHLSSTLTNLSLFGCQIPPADAAHIRSLRALNSLSLNRSFTHPLEADTVASMTIQLPQFRNDIWPNLTYFYHR